MSWVHLGRLLLGAAICLSCQQRSDAPHTDHGHDDAPPRPSLSHTRWSESDELFIEFPALVREQESRCAAHVTRLEPFSPLTEGTVAVILRGPQGEQRFEVTNPSAPGIFRPVLRPTHTGAHQMHVEVRARDFVTTHDLGEVVVYETFAAVPAEAEGEASAQISFLKEQQWPIEFGTTVVRTRTLRPSQRVFATTRARAGADVTVVAPTTGRVLRGTSSAGQADFPRIGAAVSAQATLATLAPRLDSADVASLDLAVQSTKLELQFAEREHQRLKDLAVEGAVPERRVAEAAHVLEEAKAAQLAAQRRSSQFHRLDQNVGRSDGAVVLRSPIAGVVDEVFVTVGAFVQIGDPLFRVIDASELWIEARVPVAQIAGVRNLTAAWFLVEGRNAPIELDASALVARGQAVDPTTLTVPVVFTTGNTASGLPIGAVGDVFLQTEESYSALAVPQTAVVDDGGTPVVFVQVEGESFERRVVRLGAKDAHYVEVRQGLQEGEHVVSLGGWSIKLAASSGVVPAHGHAH